MADNNSVGNPALRALLGFVVLACVAAVPVTGYLMQERVDPRPDGLSDSLLTLLEAEGLYIPTGKPSDTSAQLRELANGDLAASLADLSTTRGTISTAEGTPFTGYAVERFEGGELASVFPVFRGDPIGPAIRFYPGGQIERAVRYLDGRLVGQIIEYYPNGQLRLRAVAGPVSQNGGTAVAQLLTGRYGADGYARSELGSGRIQFISPSGSTTSENERLGPHEFAGSMVFRNGWFGAQYLVTPNASDWAEQENGNGAARPESDG